MQLEGNETPFSIFSIILLTLAFLASKALLPLPLPLPRPLPLPLALSALLSRPLPLPQALPLALLTPLEVDDSTGTPSC